MYIGTYLLRFLIDSGEPGAEAAASETEKGPKRPAPSSQKGSEGSFECSSPAFVPAPCLLVQGQARAKREERRDRDENRRGERNQERRERLQCAVLCCAVLCSSRDCACVCNAVRGLQRPVKEKEMQNAFHCGETGPKDETKMSR